MVTSFTMRTTKLSSLVLFFLHWPWSKAGRVMSAWQSWAPHGPSELWANVHLAAGSAGRRRRSRWAAPGSAASRAPTA